MYKADEKYGKVRMNSYLPTQRVIKFLNYFQTVGWHHCNSLYHQTYENGISGALLIFTIGGKGSLKLKEKTHILTAGTVAIIPPNSSMEYFTYPENEWEFYWINLYGTHALQMVYYILEEQECVLRLRNMTDYLEIIKYLIFFKAEKKFRFELEVSQKISGLLHEIVKVLYFISTETSISDNLSMKIITHIEQHYMESVNLAGLSELFFLSQNQLIRVFQSDTGYSPYEYLKKYRLLKACELLQMTNHRVEEIGVLVGFPNSSNFIFQFKAQYGVTPNNYRKLYFPISNR